MPLLAESKGANVMVSNQGTRENDWDGFVFDKDKNNGSIKKLRFLNFMCWGGTLLIIVLMIIDIVKSSSVIFDTHFFLLLGLSVAFTVGTFKCERRINFLKYQIAHFSGLEKRNEGR